MSLRDRLRRIERRSARSARSRPERRVPAPAGPERLPQPAAVVETATDGVVRRVTTFSLDQQHGRFPLAAILDADPATLGLAARLSGPLDPRAAAFLDTETTALGGGASVYVFMVGVLLVEPAAVVAHQLLLAGPEHEEPYLAAVRALVPCRRPLVTFFGKTFDRHRLDDRFALNAGDRPVTELPHLDLYHVGRRLFGARLPNARLRTLEQAELDVFRQDDLDGAECPDAYYDWVKGEDDGRMERVFKHNLIDILSLLTLTVRVDQALREPEDPRTAAAAGLVFLDAGRAERALPLLERSLDGLEPGVLVVSREERRAALELARLLRRRREPEAAIRVLARFAAALPIDPEPLEMVAKIAEHDLRDHERALTWARRVVGCLVGGRGGRRAADRLERARRRVARLEDRPRDTDAMPR